MRSLILVSCALLGAHAEDGGQLQRARDEVHPARTQGSNTPSASPSTPSSSSTVGSEGESLGPTRQRHWTLFGWLFPEDDTAPYQPPIHHERAWLDYPYVDGHQGKFFDYIPRPPVGEQPVPEPTRMSSVPGAVRGEYTDCGNGLARYAGALQISLLETEWQRYLEDLPSGATDSLTLGTLGLGLPLPIHDAFVLTVGAGASWYHDSYDNDELGYYGKLGVEIFPIRPLILNAEVWGGFIRADEYDSETFLGGGRATLGVIWNRFEIYGGWQATWIGAVTLDGPTCGLRVWF